MKELVHTCSVRKSSQAKLVSCPWLPPIGTLDLQSILKCHSAVPVPTISGPRQEMRDAFHGDGALLQTSMNCNIQYLCSLAPNPPSDFAFISPM